MESQQFLIAACLVCTSAFLSYKFNKLNALAAVVGGFLGLLIYLGTRYAGLTMLGVFFLLASFSTSWKREEKWSLQPKEKEQTARDVFQVIANGGVAALLASIAVLVPASSPLMLLMLAGSLSAAAADTVSSEMGVIYGSQFYNVLTFRKDLPGRDGVVSLEGTAFGLAASFCIALVYGQFTGSWTFTLPIVISGAAGNLVDSILGAALERKNRISNNMVNFLNTLAGALVASFFGGWLS